MINASCYVMGVCMAIVSAGYGLVGRMAWSVDDGFGMGGVVEGNGSLGTCECAVSSGGIPVA